MNEFERAQADLELLKFRTRQAVRNWLADSEISNLEWRVIEKAERWAEAFRAYPESQFADNCDVSLLEAVDALITAREKAEKEQG